MRRIGLTGAIAAGKSTVAERMAEAGAQVIDYDKLAHDLSGPGSPAIELIRMAFGNKAITEQGALDRVWMAAHVFAANGKQAVRSRHVLESILHPLIYRAASESERQILGWFGDNVVIVHDIPLLTEVYDELPFRFDHIATVEAPVALRVERMMRTRGMSRAQALARIASQTDDRWRERISDVIIDGSTSIEQMFEQVDSLMSSWRREMEGK